MQVPFLFFFVYFFNDHSQQCTTKKDVWCAISSVVLPPPPPFGTLSNDYKSSSVSEYRFVKRLKYETFNTFILYFETTTALLL